VTDEPVEFEKYPVEVPNLQDNYQSFGMVYLKLMEKNRKTTTCNLVGLGKHKDFICPEISPDANSFASPIYTRSSKLSKFCLNVKGRFALRWRRPMVGQECLAKTWLYEMVI
jgi:hypothetical protein